MAVIRWNPASDLINLHSEMDRLFGNGASQMREQATAGAGSSQQAG